jgi:AraC-like DNA-binding protein
VEPLVNANVLVAGAAFGALILVLAAMVAPGGKPNLRWAIGLFCASAINNIAGGLLVASVPRAVRAPLDFALETLGAGHGGLFWLAMLVLFEDRRLRWPLFTPALALIALEVGSVLTVRPAPSWQVFNYGYQILQLGLVLHVLYVIVRSWRGDLVETRRRLRWMICALGAAYGALSLSVALTGFRAAWFSALDNLMNGLPIVIFAALVVQVRTDLILAPAAASGLSEAARLTLERLRFLMEEEQAWRVEALTIGKLAARAGASERSLRRLINERLGFANFSGFLNSYRVEAAKEMLAETSAGERTVADIAFALGYTSLGPFNRAFKAATGDTPTAWRKQTIPRTNVPTAGLLIPAKIATRPNSARSRPPVRGQA